MKQFTMNGFPSPLEVYRFISVGIDGYTPWSGFPSPLEVYRFISDLQIKKGVIYYDSFRPLSRYIGLYPEYAKTSHSR